MASYRLGQLRNKLQQVMLCGQFGQSLVLGFFNLVIVLPGPFIALIGVVIAGWASAIESSF